MEEGATKRVDRIGVVATDTLRVLGLQSILPQFEVIHLTAPGALDDVNLALVLIDAECTGHLFELLATFHHIRPQLKLIVLGTETGPEYIQRIIGTGAKGYLTLTATETELAMAIDMVRDGSVWAPRRVLSRLLYRAARLRQFRERAAQVHAARTTGAGAASRWTVQPRDRHRPGDRREHGESAHRPPAAQGGREQPDCADHPPLYAV